MARTPAVTREAVPGPRGTFDAIVAERGGVPSGGPGSAMLNAPEVAQRALGLALFLRTDTSLEPRIRELAMLVAARENDCQYMERRPAGASSRVAQRTGRRLEGPERTPRPPSRRGGCGGVRPTDFPHPARQPGSVRCRGVPIRRHRGYGVDNPDGLLLDAGFQCECFRG